MDASLVVHVVILVGRAAVGVVWRGVVLLVRVLQTWAIGMVVVVLHGVRPVVGPDQAQNLRPLPRVAVLPRLALGQPLHRSGLQGHRGHGGRHRLLLLLLLLVPVEVVPGGNCIKIGFPGKSIIGDYFQENGTSRRPFLLLRISFPGSPIFIQFIPGGGSR